eukprot:TRINITY_DN10027_c0_g1_i1.p1 TRINITY_DN10027_c0_g1~~TRINITY_DN10027_c0_g1_i1.p1  ORF type:complete len:297 (+),score=61.92 TRINITY_DN10027_c0_g1_i1:68-892(+)
MAATSLWSGSDPLLSLGMPAYVETGDEFVVRIENLPACLLAVEKIRALLVQTGIDNGTARCHIDASYDVVVTFPTAEAAEACVKCFHGRSWPGFSSFPTIARLDESYPSTPYSMGYADMSMSPAARLLQRTRDMALSAVPPPPSAAVPPPPPGLAPPPGLSAPPGLALCPPRCATRLALTVRLENLPQRMLSSSMLETMFEQAGLEDAMTSCIVNKEGFVLVSFKSEKDAKTCVQHFDGRKWAGAAVAPVVASLVLKDDESTDAGSSHEADSVH